MVWYRDIVYVNLGVRQNNYRLYDPRGDGKTKLEHVQEMGIR